MIEFYEYWRKFCPTYSRTKARKMWNDYKQVAEVSTDFNIPKKENMFAFPVTTPQLNYMMNEYSNIVAPLNYPQDKPCTEATVPCQKGNNPMYVENDKHIESNKINYLSQRLNSAEYHKEVEIAKFFNLNNPQAPSTPEALVEAITSGNYTIPPKSERCRYERPVNQIIWRAPTVVADEAGAEAARKALTALVLTARDSIAVGAPADALTAIKAIDSYVLVTSGK